MAVDPKPDDIPQDVWDAALAVEEDIIVQNGDDCTCSTCAARRTRLIASAILADRRALPPAVAEPVAWQHRFKNEGDERWSDWVTHSSDPTNALSGKFEVRALYASPPDASNLAVGVKPTHRHKKRGTEYVLIGVGNVQSEEWFDGKLVKWEMKAGSHVGAKVDMREVAIYRSVDDGSLWVRPREEFEDGRFEPFSTAPQPSSPVGRDAVEGEPVAWRYRSSYNNRWEFWPNEAWAGPIGVSYRERHPEAEPLYATPPSQPARNEVIERIDVGSFNLGVTDALVKAEAIVDAKVAEIDKLYEGTLMSPIGYAIERLAEVRDAIRSLKEGEAAPPESGGNGGMSGADNDNRPYSSEELATRWGVSAQHVRDLIAKGDLRHFRVGRLIRIPATAVREFEECQPTASSSTAANITPSGQERTPKPTASPYVPPTARKRSAA